MAAPYSKTVVNKKTIARLHELLVEDYDLFLDEFQEIFGKTARMIIETTNAMCYNVGKMDTLDEMNYPVQKEMEIQND